MRELGKRCRTYMEGISARRGLPYAAAFFLPFLICVFICIGNGVYPFGDNCILHIDMYHQYCPFFTEFLNKLQNGGSLQYSWNLGLGTDFVALYAYYLSSPLNFLMVLWPKQYVIEFMTLLILIKIAFCGLTFFVFLKYHYKFVGKDGKIHRNQVMPALVFSTAYALSGFVAAYSWDIMWMDSIALFPLIMVGLERLVKEKKPGMYYVTLALSIFSNYYISIMICIFLVFAFLMFWWDAKGKRVAVAFRFIWYSGLAGMTSAVLLLPEIAALGASGSAGEGFPETVEWYFSILAELGRGAVTAKVYTGNDHWPNLYAGAFSLILVWLYVLNRRISWKEKLPRILMLVFFLVSFANNQLDYIWHGMHFPQALPGRQSFLYIFLLLSIGFATVRKWKGTKEWHVVTAVVLALVLLLVSGIMGEEKVTESYALVITALFLLIYGILLLLIRLTGKKVRRLLCHFVLAVAILELAINMSVTGLGVTSRVAYTEKQDFYQELLEMAKEDAGEELFYRVEDTGRKTKNDDSLYGYQSSTIFSSLINLDVSHFFQTMYMEGGLNFYCYNGATPLPSSMLGVRYMLSSNQMEESPVRTLIGTCNGNYLYRNQYCLPLGYMMPEQAIVDWQDETGDRISSLNSLARALGAKEDMIAPVTCVTAEAAGKTTIDIMEDGYYYAAYVSCGSDNLTVTRSDGWTKRYSKTSHRYLIELGECKAGTQIHISNSNAETISYHVYRMDFEALQKAYETLREQTMTLSRMTDREVQGSITVQKEGRLVLSVPADEGWELWVDGEKTDIEPLKEALIGVHLPEGTHRIYLRYTTPGLKMGAIISVISVFLFVVSILINRTTKKRKKDGTEKNQYCDSDV